MQNFKNFRRGSISGRSANRRPWVERSGVFSSARRFVVRLLEKHEISPRLPGGLARIFLRPVAPLTVRPFHSSVGIHFSPQFNSTDFTIFLDNQRNDASRGWRAAELPQVRDEGSATRSLARCLERVFAHVGGPFPSSGVYSVNPAAVVTHPATCPVPLVFLRSSHPLSESRSPEEVKQDDVGKLQKQISQLKSTVPEFAPEQVTRLTDRVLQAIDQRIVAQRERRGRL